MPKFTSLFIFQILYLFFKCIFNIAFQMKGATTDKEVSAWMEHVQDRPFNDPRYPLSSNKLRKLGWEPKVSWEDGLEKTSELFCRCIVQSEIQIIDKMNDKS